MLRLQGHHVWLDILPLRSKSLDSVTLRLYAGQVRRVALHLSDERRQPPHSTDGRPRGRELPGSFLVVLGEVCPKSRPPLSTSVPSVRTLDRESAGCSQAHCHALTERPGAYEDV